MFKITVGIRAYNVENYVEQCLNSVYNQTIKDNIQLVIVEDCSTDNTLNMINNWIDTHKSVSVRLYNNSVNRGAGVGLMLLQEYIQDTEYVIILDGDDFYTKLDCLEYMYNFIKIHNFDFVKFSKHINDYHVKNLVKYNIYKQINFNPFRYDEDGYTS
jgi:glycosyltransferase involved in cell wall biosynthesis